ncbi:MAG: hypothetical protein HY280_07070 [Nitrospinae bacterium]|nr:hypothetical protein [Nitrospinota bacterium]
MSTNSTTSASKAVILRRFTRRLAFFSINVPYRYVSVEKCLAVASSTQTYDFVKLTKPLTDGKAVKGVSVSRASIAFQQPIGERLRGFIPAFLTAGSFFE